MRKIFVFLFIAVLAFIKGNSQGKVTFTPPTFTAIDPVTLIVDVSGTDMAGENDAYIWIFSNPTAPDNDPVFPKKDGKVNGSWGNSSAEAKMTAAGTNKWKFTFTAATDLFGQTPAQLRDFGFLVKTVTGSKKTSDFKPFTFESLVFKPTLFRTFPAKVAADDVITVNMDKSLATDVTTERMTPTSVTVTFYSDASATPAGTLNDVPVRKNGNIWMATFMAAQANLNLPAGAKLSAFKYKFNGTILDTEGKTVNTSTTETEVPFSDLK